MTFILFSVAHRVHQFFCHTHRARTKRVLMHSSAALASVDCVKAFFFGGEMAEHIAHICGTTGAVFAALVCYLESE